MKSSLLLIATLSVLLSCSSTETKHYKKSQTISVAGKTANFLQMAQDRSGNVLAWWVEKDENTEEAFVYFSKSTNSTLSFEQSHKILASRKVYSGSEHMPKLVVKPDGTYLLVFAQRNEHSDAPFASSVRYIQSFDDGTTWTTPKLIHSDTNPDNGHGFPEVALLGDGEVGAAWLDGRNNLDHSEIYFAKTNGEQGFGTDRAIGGPACQCCKLDMYLDAEQNAHLVYRSLTGDNIRDINHILSQNNGKDFSAPSRISNDNWQIRACPHNGPSVTKSNNNLFVIWYTQGGEEGLYYARSQDNGQTFSSRQKLATQAKKPYIASNQKATVAVWDEIFQKNDDTYSRVKMARISEDGKVSSNYLSPENVETTLPYLKKMNNGNIIVNWTQELSEGNKLHYLILTE